MDKEVKAWAEGMGIDVENATDEQIATIEANYAGRNGKPGKKPVAASTPFEAAKLEAQRRTEIQQISDRVIEGRKGDLEFIESVTKMHDHAIEAKMSPQEYRIELYESMVPISAACRLRELAIKP